MELKNDKKTLTEECWIKVGQIDEEATLKLWETNPEAEMVFIPDTTFEIQIDYPTYPHNATIDRLSIQEAREELPPEPSWSYYVRAVIKKYRGITKGGKDYQPKLEKNLLSIEDFQILHGMGIARMIYREARKKLDFSNTDKKK